MSHNQLSTAEEVSRALLQCKFYFDDEIQTYGKNTEFCVWICDINNTSILTDFVNIKALVYLEMQQIDYEETMD